MNLKDIKEVKKELARFNSRLLAVESRINGEDDMLWLTGCKETGALRRAAMDLKNELTKITK
jgi:hypothetical protein